MNQVPSSVYTIMKWPPYLLFKVIACKGYLYDCAVIQVIKLYCSAQFNDQNLSEKLTDMNEVCKTETVKVYI